MQSANVMKRVIIYYIFCILSLSSILAQDQENTPDALYARARIVTFEDKDYDTAVQLLKAGLQQAPDYLEMRVFLGRVYTFSGSYNLARESFEQVLQKEEGRLDASLAFTNLEYWNGNVEEALKRVNYGLQFNPDSEELQILKAKILYELRQSEDASAILDNLLEQNPKNSEARSLQQGQNSLGTKNAIGASYEYVYFDKRFDDPWHISFIDYSRQTDAGLFTARVNYANRFGANALQGEIEGYPRISERFYGYVNLGFSDASGVFPKFRGGINLYANLPAAFEVDAGLRYLVFEDDQLIYTLGAAKYLGNFWLNLRTYIIPEESKATGSLAFTLRYYLGGRDDYFGMRIGTGLSPDNSANSILFNGSSPSRLKSNNLAVFWRTPIAKLFIFSLESGVEDQQFSATERGNQINVALGLIKRF